MDFRIADAFTDSLSKLTSGEQKAVKATALETHSTTGAAQLSGVMDQICKNECAR